jgi:protein-tyrosine phosphatase
VSITVSEAELRLRWVRRPGTVNVWDVGGYRTVEGRCVRWRTLLRGDSLHGLTSDELERLRAGLLEP